ncbi:hypothetical protein DRJ16_02135 [Candidatus Woesearchaeota archaeon]|nr:MAG: hypothetical protein DRJ16_02135 [Candidatus Woesearchaeota archaeon]
MTNEERLEQLVRDYKTVFGSEAGKRVLEDLKRICNVLFTSFRSDPYETAFCEGQRSVFLHIQTMVERDMEEIKKLIEEGYYE